MDVPTTERLTVQQFINIDNVGSAGRIANIRVNELRELPTLDFLRICICASGPSLADHVGEIRQRQRAGWHVAAMNGSYKFLLERGITPNLFFMVDARKGVNLPFLDDPSIRTEHVIASQVDPEIFERLHSYRVTNWSMFHDQEGYDAIRETRAQKYGDHQPQQPAACFAGRLNVGQSCLAPIWARGYRSWALFGYDGSMRGESTHAFDQPQNAGEEVKEFYWPVQEDGSQVEGISKRYLCTPTMASAAQSFPQLVQDYRAQGVTIELHGDGLIPDMVRMLAPIEQPRTVASLEGQQIVKTALEAKPRRKGRSTHGLPIVTFKWNGHIPYTAEDVRIWANQVSRFMRGAHELVCITDEPDELLDAGIPAQIVEMWNDKFEYGKDWHRLKLFAEEMADVIGPRFAVMDLDTVICGELDPLFDTDAPYKAWSDPFKDQYCTALQLMDAGAFPHVWTMFDRDMAMQLRKSGRYNGYDQAWISHVLPGQARWTAADGVLSFRKDVMGWPDMRAEGHRESEVSRLYRNAPPLGARVINFHGKYKPRDADVQKAFPWIGEYYR